MKLGSPFDKSYPITSPWGDRKSPITGKVEFHNGVDFGCPEGTNLYACEDGVVDFAGVDSVSDGALGVVIKYPQFGNVKTGYWHLKEYVVKAGQKVAKGQLIGHSGKTGQLVRGAHLHFEVWIDNKNTNPLAYVDLEDKARGVFPDYLIEQTPTKQPRDWTYVVVAANEGISHQAKKAGYRWFGSEGVWDYIATLNGVNSYRDFHLYPNQEIKVIDPNVFAKVREEQNPLVYLNTINQPQPQQPIPTSEVVTPAPIGGVVGDTDSVVNQPVPMPTETTPQPMNWQAEASRLGAENVQLKDTIAKYETKFAEYDQKFQAYDVKIKDLEHTINLKDLQITDKDKIIAQLNKDLQVTQVMYAKDKLNIPDLAQWGFWKLTLFMVKHESKVFAKLVTLVTFVLSSLTIADSFLQFLPMDTVRNIAGTSVIGTIIYYAARITNAAHNAGVLKKDYDVPSISNTIEHVAEDNVKRLEAEGVLGTVMDVSKPNIPAEFASNGNL